MRLLRDINHLETYLKRYGVSYVRKSPTWIDIGNDLSVEYDDHTYYITHKGVMIEDEEIGFRTHLFKQCGYEKKLLFLTIGNDGFEFHKYSLN